jgi:methylmalonyl-CoA mutase cobalamin-binding subunit
VAGVTRFLDLAADLGYQTHFTGPATDPEEFVEHAVAFDPDIVGVSYRLTPANARYLLDDLKSMLAAADLDNVRLVFGGTPPVAEVARDVGIFEHVFDGSESVTAVVSYLNDGLGRDGTTAAPPQRVLARIRWKAPFPLLRHHYGAPALTIEPTVAGIERIAESGALDVISLGVDQDAQENLFRPEMRNPRSRGAGGVPVRSERDLERLYLTSRRGNLPLLRSYSGTADHLRYADLLRRKINNAWCATSLFWFNAMDGRGLSPLRQSIEEHVALMRWHGERDIPVEGNEPYHWGLRDAPDVVVVAVSAIYALVARAAGVRDYIATYMFETPPLLSNRMDLAKALAQIELAESAATDDFRVWRQTRTGLLSYPVDPVLARAHMAQSVMLQMALRPHIVHVVGYCEADHAATAPEVIESCRMVDRVIGTAMAGNPDMTADPAVQARKRELVREAGVLLKAIRQLGSERLEPLTDPATLERAVRLGLLDAPQLVNNAYARGRVRVRSIDGAIVAINDHGEPQTESERVTMVVDKIIERRDH